MNFLKFLIIVNLFLFVQNVYSQKTYTWTGNGGSGNWMVSTNWSSNPTGGTYPGSNVGDNVIINSCSTNCPNTPTSTISINSLTMGTGSQLVLQTASVLNISGTTTISGGTITGTGSGSGTSINITGGSTTIDGTNMNLPYNATLNIGTSTTPVPSCSIGLVSANDWTVQLNVYTNNLQLKNSTFRGNGYNCNFKVINNASNIAHVDGCNFIANMSFESAGTVSGADLILSSISGSVYSANAAFKNTGAGNLYTGYNFGDTFNPAGAGGSNFNNSGTGNIFISRSGNNVFNRNSSLLNSSAAPSGIYFGQNGGITNLGSTYVLNPGSFTAGVLELKGVQQASTVTTAQSFTLTGTATLKFETGSVFYGSVTSSSPGLVINGTTFNGDANLTKNGSATDNSTGGFNFAKVTALIIINNVGTGGLYLGPGTYQPQVSFYNLNLGGIYPSNTGSTYYNGGIAVKCTTGTTTPTGYPMTGVMFGNNGGLSYFPGTNPNNPEFVVAGSLNAGLIELKNIIQQNPSNPFNVSATSNALVRVSSGCIFNGPVTITAPRLELNGADFKNTATFTKNGGGGETSTGGNIFENDFSLTNSGTADITMANLSGDTYLGNATFAKTNTGNIYPAYASTNYFSKNITVTGAMSFGYGNGITYLNGSASQLISGNVAPSFTYVTIDKSNQSGNNPDVFIGTNITISKNLTFNNAAGKVGHLVTTYNSTTSTVTFTAGATVSNPGISGFIEGQISKVGTEGFLFPIGKRAATSAVTSSDIYRPISFSYPTPPGTAVTYTASYVNNFNPQNYGNALNATDMSECEYWVLSSTSTTPANVTLNWDPTTCSPINKNVMSISRYNPTTLAWDDAGVATLTGDNYTGSVTSNPITAFQYITYAYKTVTILNTSQVNAAQYTVTGADNFHGAVFTSGPNGSGIFPGNIKIHPVLPTASCGVGINILQGNNLPLNLCLTINSIMQVTAVKTYFEGALLDMSPNYWNSSPMMITFTKQPTVTSAFNITTNVGSDGLTIDRSQGTTNFQITIPSPGFTSYVLKIWDKAGTLQYTSSTLTTSPVSWTLPTTAVLPAAGGPYVYKFELDITSGTSTYPFTGQFILK